MARSMRLSTWPAALCSGALLAGCAPEADYGGVATNPVTMVCDGGRTFSVAYADNFETAVIEAEGRRFELPRLYTAASLNPEPPRFGERRVSPRSRGAVGEERLHDPRGLDRSFGGTGAAGTTGVRYGDDEALFVSRNRGAVLQLGDATYSNCEVQRA